MATVSASREIYSMIFHSDGVRRFSLHVFGTSEHLNRKPSPHSLLHIRCMCARVCFRATVCLHFAGCV